MQIKDITIGQALYYVGNYPGMRSMHGMSGFVRSVDEQNNDLVLEMTLQGANRPTAMHLTANDVSPNKPASREELRASVTKLAQEVIDQQTKIELLEAQAEERSRTLERVKGEADERGSQVENLDVKLKQANNQILRHETSLDALRKDNESLVFEKGQMAEKLAVMTHDRNTLESLYHDSVKKRTAMQAEIDKLVGERDQLKKLGDNMADSGESEIAHLKQQAILRDQIIESWEKRADQDTSIITSLRSQIESLQSIQESMKMMQEGHAPAMKKLQGELHTAIHQREQHKQNSAFWRQQAIAMGYVPGGTNAKRAMAEMAVSDDKLTPTHDDRLDKIEAFLRDQFESFK